MNKPVAITGATGFVGRHLTRLLLDAGRKVRVLVRDPAKLGDVADLVEVVAGDIGDRIVLSEFLHGAGGVIHCAGVLFAQQREDFFAVNQIATGHLAEAAAKAGIERFVHVSTLAAREPELSDYAASKRAGESEIANKLPSSVWTIVRPPAVYGPGDKATLPLIANLARRYALMPVVADQRVSLIFVEDLARALVAALECKDCGGQIYELDDSKAGGYSWQEIASLAGQTQGREVSVIHLPQLLLQMAAWLSKAGAGRLNSQLALLSPGKVREMYHADWVVSSEADLPGWRANVQFGEGYAVTLAWCREQGWL